MAIKFFNSIDVGGEVKGTSLDINGAGDVSGTLTVDRLDVAEYLYHEDDNTYIRFLPDRIIAVASNNTVLNLNVGGDTIEFGHTGKPTTLQGSSLAFTGAATFTGVLKGPDGSGSAPTYSFSGRTDTGMWAEAHSSNDRIMFNVDGNNRAYIDSNGITTGSTMYAQGFRNYSGVWAGTTGTANNGFYFLNTAGGNTTKAMELSSGGNATFAGSVTATSLDINGNADISGNLTGVDSITASATVQAEHLYSTDDLVVDDDATISGDLTVSGINYGLYHGTTEDGYYFDDYGGDRNLSLFLKNQRADIIRYQAVDNFEYWNGSAWVADASQEANVKKLLDGRQDTMWSVPSTYYKFRFTTNQSSGWPTRANIGIQTSWSGSTWPGCQMLVEHYESSSWSVHATMEFGGSSTALNSNDNSIDNWGLMFKADSALHDGQGSSANTTRITIDFHGWSPSNASYTTIPLQNIFITSNYAGTENTDYTNLLSHDTHLRLGDSRKLILGAGDDLQIYHNGSHSFIQDAGTGDLRLLGSSIKLQNTSEANILTLASDLSATFAGSITGKDSGIIIDSLGGPYGRIHGTSSIFLGGGSTSQVQLSAALIPDGDSTRSLGSGSRYWSHTYTDAITTTGKIQCGGELEGTSLDINGNADISGTLDIGSTVTVGVDDAGHDVIFYGATSGKKAMWDKSADTLIVDGTLDVNGTSSFSGNADFNASLTANQLNLKDGGDFITFYGGDETNHSISSRDAAGTVSDDLRINSYGAVYINLDSNNNNSSSADFVIGRHGSATGTIVQDLLTLSGENGKLTVNGEVEATSLDINGNADISGTLDVHGDLEAPGIYIGSTNTSYDFYNNGTSYLNGATTIDDTLTVTTINATNYGLASGDIPNNAANTSGSSGSCTGNAATATQATNAVNCKTTSVTNSTEYYGVFVDSNANGFQDLHVGAGLRYNPDDDTLTTGKITSDTVRIVEDAKSTGIDGTAGAGQACMTITGAGAGNESNITLKLVGTSHGSPVKMKMIAEDTEGIGVGNGIISFHPNTDTFGIGQTTTHNSMAILIDNSDVVSFKNQATFTNGIDVTSAVNSTSKTTGTVKIAGGVGIAKALNVGEDVVAYASSDERYKDNLQAITNPIDKVKSLTGYTFTWNDKHEQFNGNDDIGVVAQEVEKVFPEIVDTRDNGYKAVKYEKMVAVLIEAVKDQQKQIDELKEKLNGNS